MTDMNEKQREQERVNHVLHVIEQKMHSLEEKTGGLKQDIVQLRKTFWDDVTVNLDEPDDIIETHTSLRQQAELLSERERSHGQFFKQYKNLTRLKNSPYFGRIDFLEEDEKETEKIYIGLFSLLDENQENFLVYDWRAPISSMYYDFAPGSAHYQTMDGKIKGEIELKRQYIIRDGHIKGMFDTGITIGDEILQAVLSDQADTQMKNIVATIQKEQNEIIRNDEKKYLVVQGAAGSGKTSAALQRVAYLLYKYREKLQADNILLFSPNQLFNSYVATVLPELGEDNMEQSTFYQYLTHRLKEFDVEDSYTQLEYILSEKQDRFYPIRKKSILFKADLIFKEIIDKYVDSLQKEGMLFKNISFRGERFITREEILSYFYSIENHITIPNRIQILRDWLLEKVDEKEKEERTKDWVLEESELLDREDYLKVYRKLQKEQRFSDKTFNDYDREEKMLAELIVRRKLAPLRRKINDYAFVDIKALYNGLFTWAQTAIEGNILPEEWDQIGAQTGEQLKRGKIYYEDATPYLYLKDKLEGKQVHVKIRHLFIDEAQDYSPFQFAFFKEIFPNSKMTILGDVNQSIFTHSVGEQNGLLHSNELFPKDQLEKIILTKSYRSTKQIVEFTEGMLKDEHEIIPFNRSGNLPSVVKVENQEALHKGIVETVEVLQNNGYDTIAIICKTVEETNQAYEALKGDIDLHLVKKESLTYEKGLLIIPSYLAKGIEFDAVIIYNSAQNVYRDEDERKLFYTACTRAMHELYLFTVGIVTPFINDIEQDKYRLVRMDD